MPQYLCLRYPFIFIYGEPGWHIHFPRAGISWRAPIAAGEPDEEEDDGLAGPSPPEQIRYGRNGSTKVSQQQWWRFMLQIREPLAPMLSAGRLLHEIMVDAYASIMMARLRFHRQHQNEYRMDRARG